MLAVSVSRKVSAQCLVFLFGMPRAPACLLPVAHWPAQSPAHALRTLKAACLQRQRERGDLRFIGVIGSATKWATFRSRLRHRGFSDAELAGITCPIGLPGIVGKQPAVIAAAVVAQLLLETAASSPSPLGA